MRTPIAQAGDPGLPCRTTAGCPERSSQEGVSVGVGCRGNCVQQPPGRLVPSRLVDQGGQSARGGEGEGSPLLPRQSARSKSLSCQQPYLLMKQRVERKNPLWGD